MQTKYVSNTLEDWEVGTTVKWQKFLSIGAYILLMDRGWQRPKFTTIKKLFKKLQNILLMFAINSIFFVVNLFFFPTNTSFNYREISGNNIFRNKLLAQKF